MPQAPQSASPDLTTTTIRTYSNLVVVDVVVTDAQGNPVRGLDKDTFTLTENGKPQTLRHFEEHSAAPVSDTKVVAPPKMPPGLFSNRTGAVANGPVNVLLLDYLNTPVNSQPYATKQLLDYLDHAAPGTRIAIFGLTTQLYMLQGFTSDIAALKNALNPKKGGAPQVSQILSNPVGGGAVGDTTLSDALTYDPTAVDGMITQEMVDAVNRFEALQTSFQQDMRAQYTLGAFDSLARYLVGIPGRKNVIWFSGSFPLDVEPNPNEADPNDSVVRNDELVRETDNLLTRAQVAVYPVDVRGLLTDPSQNFNNQSNNPIDANSGANAAATTAAFMQQTAMEHETMFAMAEDTGGQAYVNTNGLTQAVQKAVDNGSNYYTLTYSPTNMVWDSRFRAIKVKVDQPGVKLNYRNGYYAVDPNDRNKVYAQGTAALQTQPTTMVTAMMHGGPDPAQILFKVRIRPAATPPEDAVLRSNQANPSLKIEGPFRSYGVDLVPDPHAVSCRQEPNGNRHCALEVWTFVYDSNGDKLITASNRLRTMLTPADYTKLLTGGMAFHQEISVPVKGQYFIRTAIHDMVSDRVGAVEIPVAAVARLTPLKTLASTSGPEPAGPVLQDLSGGRPGNAAPAPGGPAVPPR